MELKVVIDKKSAFMIFGAILILAGAIYGYAQSGVPNPGHSGDEILVTINGEPKLLNDALENSPAVVLRIEEGAGIVDILQNNIGASISVQKISTGRYKVTHDLTTLGKISGAEEYAMLTQTETTAGSIAYAVPFSKTGDDFSFQVYSLASAPPLVTNVHVDTVVVIWTS